MDAERPDHREGMPRHVNLVSECGISVDLTDGSGKCDHTISRSESVERREHGVSRLEDLHSAKAVSVGQGVAMGPAAYYFVWSSG